MLESLLFVGLGNKGAEFKYTRHNLGIAALTLWVTSNFPDEKWHEDIEHNCEIVNLSFPERKITCLFPLTMMNNSGSAVKSYAQKNGVEPSRILIVHDDLETPLGEIKIIVGGGARGHNGVRSIHEYFGTNKITRLLLGIGRPTTTGEEPDKFVLSVFTAAERPLIDSLHHKSSLELTRLIQQGLPRASDTEN